MKNIKDITLSIFAVIGFVALLSSFTNQPQSEVTNGTPESHVWEIYGAEGNYGYLLNKATGEVMGLRAERNAKMILKTIDTR